MNKNNIIGFLLIAVVLIGFSWYNQPSAEEQRTAFVQDSIAKAKHAEMEKASKAAAAKRQTNAKAKVEADSTALFYSALKGQAKKIVLKNEKVELTLNTKGATVEKAVIKGYVGHNLQVKDGSADAKDVTLFDGNDQSLKFMLEAKEANIITSDLYFTPSNVTDKSVTLTAVAGEGKTLTMTYTLGNDYMLHMSLQANGMAGLFSPNYNKMDVDWSDKARQQERGFMFENRYTTLTYHNAEGGTDHLSEGSEKIDEKIEEAIDWVSFKNQFFSAIIVAKDNFEKDAFMTSIPQEKGSGYLKQFQAKMKTAFDPTGKKASEFEFYFGPNDFQILKNTEKESTFGSTSIRNEKHLSPFSLNLLIINTVVPILFAYGRHRGEEKYCDRAFDFLEELKAENNHIVRMWKECGLPVENAGDSQALIQLKKEYCDRKECLRCRIGYEYLKR